MKNVFAFDILVISFDRLSESATPLIRELGSLRLSRDSINAEYSVITIWVFMIGFFHDTHHNSFVCVAWFLFAPVRYPTDEAFCQRKTNAKPYKSGNNGDRNNCHTDLRLWDWN